MNAHFQFDPVQAPSKRVANLDRDLDEMIVAGKLLEAFELYYSDDVVMQENLEEPCIGKAANREREREFVASIEQIHGIELHAAAVFGDVSFCEMTFDLTFKDGSRHRSTQVARRRWRDSKVVDERFYYKG